jgi:4-amino-4-deoxy-L-arabinose transferase-like glycosyltransferase
VNLHFEKHKKVFALEILILPVLIYFILFAKLGSFQMRFWDESMFAVNTFEMMENGHYFSLYYDGLPDFYNTKPPLTSWLQILSVKVFGYNEFAIRFPSALASGLSVLFLFYFVKRCFSDILAWSSALILLSASGYVTYHTSRTGDSDALLCFFLLMANLSFIDYIRTNKKQRIFLICVFLTLAFATKLYAALLFLPAFLGVLIYTKNLSAFVWSKQFLAGCLLLIGCSISLILLRENETPGYLEIILNNDAGRLFVDLGKEKTTYWFYFDKLFKDRFALWSVLFMVGTGLIFMINDLKNRNLLFVVLVLTFSYLLIITLSLTKFEWYDMPLYPLLAIIVAIPLEKLVISFGETTILKRVTFLGLIFFYPLLLTIFKSQGNHMSYGDTLVEANERYLFQAIKKKENLDGVKVLYHNWDGALLFYKYKLESENQTIELVTDFYSLTLGDKVLVCNENLKQLLKANFELTLLDKNETAELYLVDEYLVRKPDHAF